MRRYFSAEEALKVCRQLPSNMLDSSGSNISTGSEIDEQDHEPSSNSSDSDKLLEDNIGNNSGNSDESVPNDSPQQISPDGHLRKPVESRSTARGRVRSHNVIKHTPTICWNRRELTPSLKTLQGKTASVLSTTISRSRPKAM